MMKRHRQLNQSLQMASEAAVARSLPPKVFEGLMGVEKAAGIEQGEAAPPGISLHRFSEYTSHRHAKLNYKFSY
jgi:hypothetical protein